MTGRKGEEREGLKLPLDQVASAGRGCLMHQSVCRRGFGQELGRSLPGFWDDEVTGRMGEGAVTSLLEDSSRLP